MKLYSICLSSLVFLAGCATSSGVMQLGPDTYTISTHASVVRGGAAGAKRMALEEASRHCASMGKEILVMNTGVYASNYGKGSDADLTYQCLKSGDPELGRPTYRHSPSVVIETR